MSPNSSVPALAGPFGIDKVVAGGYCVGCGGCAVATSGRLEMTFTDLLMKQAVLDGLSGDDLAKADSACPFSSSNPDEDELARTEYGSAGYGHDHRTGYFDAIYAGRIVDDAELLQSSSGGLTTWVIERLFNDKKIDGVIHVSSVEADGKPLFEFSVSESLEEISGKRKSQYYSTNFDKAVLKIRGNGKKYAFVGVPCFVKSIRLLQRDDPQLKEQISYVIGLVCGHIKSGGFAETLAYQVGVERDNIAKVDFRLKNKERMSSAYDFGALDKCDGHWKKKMTPSLIGGNWGHAMFQLKACDYCDDIFAELSDICFGDAWLPEYVKDWRGTNVVVSRSAELSQLLVTGSEGGLIKLDPIDLDKAERSQSGNFRHRREGLSIRLETARSKGIDVPRKRVQPGAFPSSDFRRKLVALRQGMAERSHYAYLEARQQGDVSKFFSEMSVEIAKMERLYASKRRQSVSYWVGLPYAMSKKLIRKLFNLSSERPLKSVVYQAFQKRVAR